MEFKPWYYLQEVIDTNDDNKIQNNLARIYDPETIKQINVYLDKYRNDPNKFRIKNVMDFVTEKYPIVKDKAQKLDNMIKDYRRRANITKEEIETLKYFFDQDVGSESLKEMMNLLRDFLSKKFIELKIVNGKPELYKKNQRGQLEKTEAPDFTRFISVLHSIQGFLEKLGPSGKYYDPRKEQDPVNLVAEGENISVFKGSMPELCRKFGKGQKWCIASSSSTQHYFNYRFKHGQTQYFIFDFNKAVDDPARYVNPGVAPPGKYSEWVDFRNQHKKDPEDPRSGFGINGYRSINDYKRYLASKGVNISVFVADPIQDWELRLKRYVDSDDFLGAKNDVESVKLLPSFLKFVKIIRDDYFDMLTDAEKKVYVLKKWATDHQRKWAMKNYKQEYLSSIDDLEIENDEALNFVLNNRKELSSTHVLSILLGMPNKKLEPKDLKKINLFNDEQIAKFLIFKDQIAFDLIVKYKELNEEDIYSILLFKSDLSDIEEHLGLANINKINLLNDEQIDDIFRLSQDDQNAIDLIIDYKELNEKDIYYILLYKSDLSDIEEHLGLANINKINLLNDEQIDELVSFAKDKKQILNLVVDYKKELKAITILYIISKLPDLSDIEKKIKPENLEKINSISNYIIQDFLHRAKDKENASALIAKYQRS